MADWINVDMNTSNIIVKLIFLTGDGDDFTLKGYAFL